MSRQTKFPVMLKYLREKEKISQKTVAKQLGISQALLSHYEKGIRECKLDFLVKAAKYYNVTCGYLLGAEDCPERGNVENTALEKEHQDADIHIYTGILMKNQEINNVYSSLYKSVVINSIEEILNKMKDIKYKEVCAAAGEFLSGAVYMLYKTLSEPSSDTRDITILSSILEKINGKINEPVIIKDGTDSVGQLALKNIISSNDKC